MKPILFSLGPIHIFSYGLMVAMGLFAALYGMERKIRSYPILNRDSLYDMVLVTVLSGFLGARLYYVFQNAAWYFEHPWKIFAVWEGGLIFYGGLAGAVLGLCVFFRFKKVSILKGFDFFVPYVALGQAFGRVGCFLNGCCYGTACKWPWAVSFPGGPSQVHPAQLYEVFWDGILFLLLLRIDLNKVRPGRVLAGYLAGYGLGRFVIEMFRAGNPGWFGLSWNQWISGMLVFAGILIFFFAPVVQKD